MEQYKQLIQTILDKGVEKTDRTGVGTLSVFGTQSHYDLNKGFPLLTLKKTYFKGIVHELLWFINGDTNIKYLVDNDVHIWDEWAYERYKKTQEEEAFKIGTFPVVLDFKDYVKRIKADATFASKYGDLGPIYGKQWRQWQDWKDMPSGGRNEKFSLWHDQLAAAIHTLKTNPEDRGIIVNAWNVSDLKQMALRPCHTMFQFYAIPLSERERNSHPIAQEARGKFRTMFTEKELDTFNVPKHKLSLQLYQRSADLMLGVPFNVASYALLLEMVAQQVNMVVGEFVHTCGDCHIYKNAIDAAHECLKREEFPLPKIQLNKKPSLFDYKFEDITLIDYKSHPAIKIEVAV